MSLSIERGSFDGQAYSYLFKFQWSAVYSDNISFTLEWYHSQGYFSGWSGNGFYDENTDSYFANINVSSIYPYCKYTIKYRLGGTSYEEIFVSDVHPNHTTESYIKPNRPVVHDQYATYNDAKYKYEANSCVSNTICAGMDACYRSLYNKNLRPSVGYLYGALFQNKDESYGMLFKDTLDYLTSRGIAKANLVTGEANQEKYPNNYLKQQKSIETWSGTFKTYDGAVQVFNKNQTNQAAIDSEKHAMVSSWYKDWSMKIAYNLMAEIQRTDKIVMATFGLCTEFNNASNGDGVCGRLMRNTTYNGGHASIVVGWKKIGDEFYWIIQNSWGSNRGDNGLMYIPFSWYPVTDSSNVAWAGLWEFYSIGYQNNGEYFLPSMQPPVLNTSEGKDGRGDYGTLYLSWSKPPVDIYGGYKYEIRFTYENGSQEVKSSFGWDFKDYFRTNKYGNTMKIAIRYIGSDQKETSVWSAENLATTLPKEAVLSTGQITTNSVVINASVSEGNYSDIVVHVYKDNVYQVSNIIPYGSSSTTFTSLINGATYTFDAETRYTIRGTTLISFKKSNLLTVKIGSDIKPFYWTSTIIQNGEMLNNTGSDNKWYSYPLTATEWNGYADTLKKVREAKKITTVRPLDRVSRGVSITTYINQGVNALNDMLTTKLNNVTSTSTLTAQVFLDLQNKLNDIIKTL